MEKRYNVSGINRKKLVGDIADITGIKPVYKGAPTFNYEVGEYTVTKDGTVVYEEDTDEVIKKLSERGYREDDNVGLTISMPRDKVNIENVEKLISAKGYLIKKALGINKLPIEVKEDIVSFPWFDKMPSADECRAYTEFIAALCKMSRQEKRITAVEREVENEKYEFRCFLLRLGFIGDDLKLSRKILLKNLSGSAAFRKEA